MFTLRHHEPPLGKRGRTHAITALAIGLTLFVSLADASVSFLGPTNYPAGTGPAAVAAGDFNADGKVDLAVANRGSNDVSILLGNGDGTFQAARSVSAGASPAAVVVADFNHDGRDDLAVALLGDSSTGQGAAVSVFLNNGDGTFRLAWTADETTRTPTFLAIGDFDGDGSPDLAEALGISALTVFLNNGDGTFRTGNDYATQFPIFSIAVGDLNADHIPDLVLATGYIGGSGGTALQSSGAITVLLGNGDGTFHSPVDYANSTEEIQFVTLADFNGDGKLDVAAATTYFRHPEFQPITIKGNVRLFLGDGNGGLTIGQGLQTVSGSYAIHVTSGDLNGDGTTDVVALFSVAGTLAGSFTALQNNPDGTFTLANFDAGTAVSLTEADLNHDGASDLVLVNAADGNVGVLLNASAAAALTLSLTIDGTGAGTVITHPGLALCAHTCSIKFPAGTQVSLGAKPNSGFHFATWGGACSGTASCALVMNSDQNVTATFDIGAAPDFSLSSATLTPSTINAGESTSASLNISDAGGFNSSVSFACSVQPLPPLAPTCSVNPATSSSATKVVVNTTAPTAARTTHSLNLFYALALPFAGLVLIAFRAQPGTTSKPKASRGCLLCRGFDCAALSICLWWKQHYGIRPSRHAARNVHGNCDRNRGVFAALGISYPDGAVTGRSYAPLDQHPGPERTRSCPIAPRGYESCSEV
ncbi:MAG TPA: FG-GAP-like repeat-containing protein [Terriglobales bacterium]|nr:FG-GAP-like repeat-containing protein [Terriglobales bacterium]